jgi:hypothetical protein
MRRGPSAPSKLPMQYQKSICLGKACILMAAQFAVDRQVEHGQVSSLMGVLKLNADGSDVLRL